MGNAQSPSATANKQDMGRGFLKLLGIPICNLTMDQSVQLIEQCMNHQISTKLPVEIHFVNAHCINVAARNEEYRKLLAESYAVFPDGSGIRKAGERLGTPIRGNVNGTDMFPLLCDACARSGKRMYLLGAGPQVAEKVAQWVADRSGPHVIAGFHDGFFSADEQSELLDEIDRLKPDLLLVAMGVPRQELWVRTHLQKLPECVCMGVGGLFDFYSGRIKRAPRWIRSIGFEWVWRLLMEPRRMWRRYIVGNIEFLLRLRKMEREHATKGKDEL